MRPFTSKRWFAASSLGLCLSVLGCSGDDTSTSASTTEPTSTTDPTTTDPSATDPTTSTGSTTDPSASATETDPTTDPTTDSTTTDSTTTTTDSTTTTDPTTTDPTTDTEGGVCGDGEIQGSEVCDDGNTKTEFPADANVPHGYDEGDCLDACDLLAPTCGDGVVDPGEACDDGNDDSQDDCTTSCTVNDGGFDSPCIRDCGGEQCPANDVRAGEIIGCGSVTAPAGAEKVCFDSGHVKVGQIIDRKLYFGEGSCTVVAQKCKGVFCPDYVTFGDYDNFNDCPAGTALAERMTNEGGVTVSTKVCHKACDTDSDCRWNAHDDFWEQPSQYRCQVSPDTNGVKICTDAQNF